MNILWTPEKNFWHSIVELWSQRGGHKVSAHTLSLGLPQDFLAEKAEAHDVMGPILGCLLYWGLLFCFPVLCWGGVWPGLLKCIVMATAGWSTQLWGTSARVFQLACPNREGENLRKKFRTTLYETTEHVGGETTEHVGDRKKLHYRWN